MKKKLLSLMLAVLMLAAIMLMTACGQTEDTSAEKQAEEGASDEIEQIIGCESVDFESFDILGSNDSQGFYYHSPNVYETLVRYEGGKIAPCLAESWKINGNECVFNLRQDVKFTDGSAFNAEAVKMNFDMIKSHYAELFSYIGTIAKLQSVEAVDEYTVKLIFDTPYYAVLQDLTASFPGGIMSPKVFENGNIPYVNTFDATYGTGPYKLSTGESEKGKYYTFVRNEDYWGEKAGAKKYIVKIIPDIDARMMALRTGEVDFVLGERMISQDAFSQFKSEKDFEVKLSEERARTRNLLLNTSRELLSDLNVRKAIQYGTNKSEIIENILYAMEEKADYLLDPGLPYCDVKVEPYNYDKTRAEQLLEEAGWVRPEGKRIREKSGKPLALQMIYRSGYGSEENVVQAFQAQMEDIGIDVKITGYEMMAWYGKGLEGEFDITVNDTYGLPFDPHTFISPMKDYGLDYPAQQGLSMKGEIDAKITRMFETVDSKELQNIYSYILTTLHEQAVNVPVSYPKEIVIFNKNKISDVRFNGIPNFTEVKGMSFK